jgi:site-specific recombinase XerD
MSEPKPGQRAGSPPPGWPEIPDYIDFCRHHRGLSASRLAGIARCLDRFAGFLSEQRLTQWEGLTCEHLDRFLLWMVPQTPPERQARWRYLQRVQFLQSILRGFLRYLFSLGQVDRDWALALRSPRRHRLASTPRALAADQVLSVLRGVDRTRPGGKRDFALVLLAAGLGLRVGELAALRLEGLRWREQVIWIEQSKTANLLRLPLPAPLMQALAEYLRDERGPSAYREVFLESRPPHRPLRAHSISVLIGNRLRQAGVKATAHQLRHSFAGALLETGVAFTTLQELLGHRNFTSTQVYTKIDVRQLRDVADNDAEDY